MPPTNTWRLVEKGDISDMHSLISYINNYNRLVKPNNRCKIVEELNKNIKKTFQ